MISLEVLITLYGITVKLRIEAPGFYQMNQTPSLYAGHGIYLGPGFYHNMSTLCYFIQKSSTNVY